MQCCTLCRAKLNQPGEFALFEKVFSLKKHKWSQFVFKTMRLSFIPLLSVYPPAPAPLPLPLPLPLPAPSPSPSASHISICFSLKFQCPVALVFNSSSRLFPYCNIQNKLWKNKLEICTKVNSELLSEKKKPII